MEQMAQTRILIVDDEESIRKSISRIFRVKGDFEIFTATDGEEALALMQDTAIDIVISDERMPKMRGNQFLTLAKQKYPDCMRILLTAYSDTDAILKAVNEGEIYRYVRKPWNNQELVTTVNSALEVLHLRRQNEALLSELGEKNAELKHINENLEAMVQKRTDQLKKNVQALESSYKMLNGQRAAVARLLDMVLRNAHQELGIRASRAQHFYSMLEGSEFLSESDFSHGSQAVRLHGVGCLLENIENDLGWRELTESSAKVLAMFPGLKQLGAILSLAAKKDSPAKPGLIQSVEMVLEYEAITRSKVDGSSSVDQSRLAQELYRELRHSLPELEEKLLRHFLTAFSMKKQEKDDSVKSCTVDDLRPGMVTQSPIYLTNGNTIVLEDTQLTGEVIANLKKFSAMLKPGIFIQNT